MTKRKKDRPRRRRARAVEFEVEWSAGDPVVPQEPKQPISFRVDPDVLGFFKAKGPKYQTRMNAVLRAYMDSQAGEESE